MQDRQRILNVSYETKYILYSKQCGKKKVRLAQTCPTCDCLSLHVCHAI